MKFYTYSVSYTQYHSMKIIYFVKYALIKIKFDDHSQTLSLKYTQGQPLRLTADFDWLTSCDVIASASNRKRPAGNTTTAKMRLEFDLYVLLGMVGESSRFIH